MPGQSSPWEDTYDVLVVGGGTTGLAAALAAARQGARTAIVECGGYLGGNAVAIPAWLGFHDLQGAQTVAGIAEEMVRMLQARGEATPCYRDPICGSLVGVNMHGVKLLASELAEAAGVAVYLHTEVTGASLDGNGRSIERLPVHTRAGERSLGARVVVDCSDTAAVARPAGAQLTYGRGEDGKAQVASWTFTVGGIDFAGLLAYYRRAPDEIRPFPLPDVQGLLRQMEQAEAFVMGSFRAAIAQARRDGLALPRDVMPGIAFPPRGEIVTVGVRVENVDPADSLSLGRAEREGMAQARRWLEFLRGYVPGCERARLSGTPATIGIRESYHVRGCHVLDREDLMAGRRFEDAIAAGGYHIDVHSPDHGGVVSQQPPSYQIPYRSLRVPALENLLVAGRLLSATHAAYASTRVIPISMATGEAAGIAAAMAAAGRLSVHDVPVGALQQRLREAEAILEPREDNLMESVPTL